MSRDGASLADTIKTDMTLPYTSVFLQLECGYWSPEKESRLRQALESAK